MFGDDVEVDEDPAADYLYRAAIARERVADVLRDAALDLDYESHAKDVALARSEPNPARHDAYYQTWSAMSRMQPTPPYGGRWSLDAD